jgi:2-keto-4-pentenoate hydratase/2-oxohepta-3-ene-1,7-dioic acid hydratase in catechol pathway
MVMHIARYRIAGERCWGRREGDVYVRLDAPPWLGGRESGPRDRAADVVLLAPVEPTKIVCIGLNDRLHATEMGKTLPEEPRIFLKPSTAVIGPEQPIVLPETSQRVEHEAELGVVIGRRATRVMVGDAWQHVLGYTCVNDVTARDIQKRDNHYTRAKGFDSFCPLGPWVETGVHPRPVRVRCLVNGQQRQDGHSANLIRDVPTLIAYISSTMTLLPGDVIATGTYAGTAPLSAGDSVRVEIDGVGSLHNAVMAAPTTGVFAHGA